MLPARLAALVLVVAAPGIARPGEPRRDDAHPVSVKVGEAVAVCETGTIVCPAGGPMCDDPSIAKPDEDARGLLFRGVRVGTTLCSAGSNLGFLARRVYRITVTQ